MPGLRGGENTGNRRLSPYFLLMRGADMTLSRKATEPSTEEAALRKVVEDYNATVNPGKYVLRIDPAGQFTVVGTQVRDDTGVLQTVTPILQLIA